MARLDIRFIIYNMHRIRKYLLLSYLFFLFSCNQAQIEIPESFQMEPTTSTVAYNSSTETPLPTITYTPIAVVTLTPLIVVDTPKPVFQLCSPLAEQSIQEIPEIVSDPYNPPRMGKDDRHQGTDFAYYRRKDRTTIEGEEVRAMLAGRVVAVVENQPPYGNMVIIETPQNALPAEIGNQIEIDEDESLFILYAHFRIPPLVTLGEMIACGQTLGEVGATGYNIINPHLHIETRVGLAGQIFREGMAYYDTRTSEVERSNYELWRVSGEFRHFDPMVLINEYLKNWIGE